MTKEHMELRKLQLVQYSMLKEVDKICKRYNVSYYLVYGTLLGAVRHQASIPWDYDIDIAMKRDDFKKFRKFSEKLPKEFELRDICYSSIEYASLSRVIKKDENFGDVHIDIFILDYAKEYSNVMQKFTGAIGRFFQIAKLSRSEKDILYEHFKGNKKKLAIVHLGDFLCKIFSGARIEKWNYYMLVCNKQTKKLIIMEEPHKPMNREWFSEKKLLRYEDMNFPVPEGDDELLSLWYGNYMEIPEEGKKYIEEEKAEI